MYDTPMPGGFASGIDDTKQSSVSVFSVTKKPPINQPLRKFKLLKKRVLLYDTVVFCEEKTPDKPAT